MSIVFAINVLRRRSQGTVTAKPACRSRIRRANSTRCLTDSPAVADVEQGVAQGSTRIIREGRERPLQRTENYYGYSWRQMTDLPYPAFNREAFFTLLEEFIGAAILVNFPELRNSPARCVVQASDDLRQEEFESYVAAVSSLKSTPLQFARLYFKFGDITVEFKRRPSLVNGELDCVSRGVLPRAVESPLFAFDISTSEVWLTFLMSVHWARNLIPIAVLRSIVGMAARAVT